MSWGQDRYLRRLPDPSWFAWNVLEALPHRTPPNWMADLLYTLCWGSHVVFTRTNLADEAMALWPEVAWQAWGWAGLSIWLCCCLVRLTL